MGHSVGKMFRESGLDVLTCLTGRTSRTCTLAQKAGFRTVKSLEELLEQADLVFSIIVPSAAVTLAESLAKAIKNTKFATIFVDCNAVSPRVSRQIEKIISDVGGEYLDASIIGPPPRNGLFPRFYVSGPNRQILQCLDGQGIELRFLSDEIGAASAIKMCYAGLTKGTMALHAAVLTVAERLGLSNELETELDFSQSNALKAMQQLNRVPAKAFRWINEMEQIAETFDKAGLPSEIHQGAANVFRLIAGTNLSSENPESIDTERTLKQTVQIFAQSLKDCK